MSDINYMPITEFISGGFLQELNRRFLHPMGLALSVEIDDDAPADAPQAIMRIWDYRAREGGMTFHEDYISRSKYESVEAALQAAMAKRVATHGFEVQPVP